ncbi:DUF2318 domain-containing protein [Ruminiclostridium cellobioparum]|uniref:Putative membrane protein n=1 Tax=Ruminiclostridium cellobioparum subsp. termitidis CT1112 TaxID=1195236 RepID=S0FXJ8_RUMCE|nr:DUF2318 domain-containing protein [Ruminiclostridium cellobioparum]EMS73303.1 putative membrane protein [Ruminiclostridium cellobioparum subsp. termitidis CT1112]
MNFKNKHIAIIIGIAVILVAVIFVSRLAAGGNSDSPAAEGTDVVINKSDVSETVKFYPVKIGNKNMEILAVKASDGTIRTAFNTCQVCNGSPRAYYKQEGDTLVCQNCGNRFSMDMVEQQRGGCNPIPILKEDKTDDGANITISKDFIEQNKELFTDNWKTK